MNDGAKVQLLFEMVKVLQVKDITKNSTDITRYNTDITDIKKASQLLVKLSLFRVAFCLVIEDVSDYFCDVIIAAKFVRRLSRFFSLLNIPLRISSTDFVGHERAMDVEDVTSCPHTALI